MFTESMLGFFGKLRLKYAVKELSLRVVPENVRKGQ